MGKNKNIPPNFCCKSVSNPYGKNLNKGLYLASFFQYFGFKSVSNPFQIPMGKFKLPRKTDDKNFVILFQIPTGKIKTR